MPNDQTVEKLPNVFIGFHMSEAEAKQVYELAEANSVSVSALIRHILKYGSNDYTDALGIDRHRTGRKRRFAQLPSLDSK